METKQAVFSKDIERKKITVTRSFDAPLKKVWDAWTKSEIRDLWWAPKPWKAETKTMDFREGGSWLYSMVGPKGEKQWSVENFEKINPEKMIISTDAFCDEHRKLNTDMPVMRWENEFEQADDNETEISIEITFEKEADMEKILETGFEEGFTAGLDNLDHYLNEH